jgi:hypothetical protein
VRRSRTGSGATDSWPCSSPDPLLRNIAAAPGARMDPRPLARPRIIRSDGSSRSLRREFVDHATLSRSGPPTVLRES